MKIISLGWGVQSFTLAAMVALGELEPVDYAVHADTTHESKLTYEFSDRWTGWVEKRGVRVITVKPNRSDPIDNGYGQQDVPFYSLNLKGDQGQGKRQCTLQWKIIPVRRQISLELKQKALNKTPGIIEQWIGISLDEFPRMRNSDVKYINNRYPLVENKMTRVDCVKWLETRGLEVPPRSACVFCPFHNTVEWRKIKETKEDWDKAVAVDRLIRNSRSHKDLFVFVHPNRKPLENVDLRTAEEKGQLTLWDNECSGICGV